MNIDKICEDGLIDKIFSRACEQNNIEIVKYLLLFVNDITLGFYACLFCEYIETATYIFYYLCTSEEQIKYFEKIIGISFLIILFANNKYKSVDFLLNTMFESTFNESCSDFHSSCPCPILIGIKYDSLDSIKIFLDYLIKNNKHKKLLYFSHLGNHYAFHTACKNNYIDIAKYLCDIFPFYSIVIENNIIVKYDVDYNKFILENNKYN